MVLYNVTALIVLPDELNEHVVALGSQVLHPLTSPS